MAEHATKYLSFPRGRSPTIFDFQIGRIALRVLSTREGVKMLGLKCDCSKRENYAYLFPRSGNTCQRELNDNHVLNRGLVVFSGRQMDENLRESHREERRTVLELCLTKVQGRLPRG